MMGMNAFIGTTNCLSFPKCGPDTDDLGIPFYISSYELMQPYVEHIDISNFLRT